MYGKLGFLLVGDDMEIVNSQREGLKPWEKPIIRKCIQLDI